MTTTSAGLRSFFLSSLTNGAIIAILLILSHPVLAGSRQPFQGVVNLNTATKDELQMLPGIGPAKADAIIAYRQRHPFRTIQELVRIKGLGKKTVRKLLPYLTVTGETKAQDEQPAPKEKGLAAPTPLSPPLAGGNAPMTDQGDGGCFCPCR